MYKTIVKNNVKTLNTLVLRRNAWKHMRNTGFAWEHIKNVMTYVLRRNFYKNTRTNHVLRKSLLHNVRKAQVLRWNL